MRTGVASRQPKDVSFREAIEDLETRPIYIRRMFVSLPFVLMITDALPQTSKPCDGGSNSSLRSSRSQPGGSPTVSAT